MVSSGTMNGAVLGPQEFAEDYSMAKVTHSLNDLAQEWSNCVLVTNIVSRSIYVL